MAIPIGLQLYSVRHDCEKDLEGVLDAVKAMGYDGVEFAGYYGRTAEELKALLDARNLVCCGTHVGLDTLQGDELAKTVAFNKILDNRYLIVPWIDEKRRSSRAGWLEMAKVFNELADQVRPDGMQVGYHNHHVEFTEMDGEVQWDTFFGHTKKEVIMQFDTGNAMMGGGETPPYLRKYPGRATTVHVKPYSETRPKALIGEDDLPWGEIFELCETVGGTTWYIVEYEIEGVPALEAVEKCLGSLRKMGK